MNDITTSIVVAVIGGIFGLLPVVITAIVKWSERRSERTIGKHVIERTQKRLEFLNLWIKTQKLICSDEDFATLSKDIGEELNALRNVSQSYTSIDTQTVIPIKVEGLKESREKISRWRIAVLGYWPKGTACWVFHLLFYMAFGASILLTGWAFYIIAFEAAWAFNLILPASSYILTYLFFWLPARLLAKRQDKEHIQESM